MAKGATDLRKSINTLAALVQASFEMDPYDKNMYVFCNRSRNRLKILQYDKNGFWLYYKALDQGKFAWVKETDGLMELTAEELDWLVHGLKLMDKQSLMSTQKKFYY
ncbi:MAG: IS66 family insertion sequence element accessory protein TnpB [Eubacteriales bacterium]|nr:IS66 family insertion sequence element accessory protein TnpB [Eubacteriales bacterium]